MFRWDASNRAAESTPETAPALTQTKAGGVAIQVEDISNRLTDEQLSILETAEAQKILNKMKEEIALLYEEERAAVDVDATCALSALGLDSMVLEQLAQMLETEFQLQIDLEVCNFHFVHAISAKNNKEIEFV